MLFSEETIGFLRDLGENNDRPWFEANRERYENEYVGAAKALCERLKPRLAELSPGLQVVPKVDGSILRIHRDTRFSSDKRPYKERFDLIFWKGAGKRQTSPALMLRYTPEKTYVASGLHSFDTKQVTRWRKAVIGPRGEGVPAMLEALEKGGYELGGKEYKRVPRGFDGSHPRAELLKYKSLTASVELDSDQVDDDVVMRHFEAMHPMVDWLVKNVGGGGVRLYSL
jgi:uncharacterized protein (TIGR02453 family)